MLILSKSFFLRVVYYLFVTASSKNRHSNLISMFFSVKVNLFIQHKSINTIFLQGDGLSRKKTITFSGNKSNETDRTKVMTSSSIILAENS